LPLTAGAPHGRNLAGTELPRPAMVLGLNCVNCFLSRGFSVKTKDWFVIGMAVISCVCVSYLAKFIENHRKIQKWQN
jgi:hypothetical protein